MIINGLLPAEIEPVPLTRIETAPPGAPLPCVICTPEALPWIALSQDCTGKPSISSAFTLVMAEVTSRFSSVE